MMTKLNVPTYKIAEELMPGLDACIEKLNRRAAKIGGFIHLAYWEQESIPFDNGSIVWLEVVTIEGSIGDEELEWRPVARLEFNFAAGKNIVNHMPTFEGEIPEKYRTTDTSCEHCKLKRNRKHIWVLYNKDLNEYKQVGTSCLKEFTGFRDIADTLKLADVMLDVESAVAKASHRLFGDDRNVDALTSTHFGEIKKCYRGVSVTVVYANCFGEIDWGLKCINKMMDAGGNLFIWFTDWKMDLGEYVIDFTVKNHDSCNGVDRTIITRCKIQEEL